MAQDFTVDRNSPKWVLGADGYLKEYIADAPAIEFNADGSYKGVLVEPQSVNDCLQSEDFSTTWITTNNGSVTTNQGVSPDGSTTADELTRSVAGDVNSRVRQSSITVSNSTVYTASAYIKNVDCNGGSCIGFRVSGGTLFRAKIDWSTNTISNDTGTTTQELIPYPNDWYRATMTFTTDGTSGDFEIDLDRNNANDLTSILIWGAQLEESPIATSYIPTTTGAVTRVKDDIYLTSASSLIGQTEGTLFAEVDWQKTTGLFQALLNVDDNSANNRVGLFRYNSTNQLSMVIKSNNVTQTEQGISDASITGIQKIALAYKQNDAELYVNGSSVSTDTSVDLTALATLTDVNFGQYFDSSIQANMWIRAVALFTTRLSDAECEALTTI